MVSVAVTGATGQQGGATARALLKTDAHVIALVRKTDSDAARALADAGAELRTADLTDVGATTEALRGADSAFVMATMTGPDGTDGEVRTGKAVADAVVAAGVPFAVYSSVGGTERHTDIPHFESKRRIEEYFESLDLHSSFVRPAFFMDNLSTLMRPTIEDGTIVVRLPLPGGRPLQVVAVEDIGTASAALLTAPGSAPATIEIAGDELTGEQMAEAVGAHYGMPARYETLPVEAIGDDDQEAMFTWLASSPAYESDFAGTRSLAPDVHTFAQWVDGGALGDLD